MYDPIISMDSRAILHTAPQTQQASLYQPVTYAMRRTPVAQVEYRGYGVPLPVWRQQAPYGGAFADYMGSRKAKALALVSIALLVFVWSKK